MAARQSDGSTSATGFQANAPTALTSTSRRPKALSVSSTSSAASP